MTGRRDRMRINEERREDQTYAGGGETSLKPQIDIKSKTGDRGGGVMLISFSVMLRFATNVCTLIGWSSSESNQLLKELNRPQTTLIRPIKALWKSG